MSEKLGNVAITNAEKDLEKHLLNTTIKLSDGTRAKIFSRGERNEAQFFLYSCLICGVSNLPGEKVLHTHIQGRKHQAKLQTPCFDADTYKANLNTKKTIQINIAPGEPVPPGFEGEIKAVADIQSSIDRWKNEPLIGLEYLLELTESGGPHYLCVLCNIRYENKGIMEHLKHERHRLKYLEKHFPSTIKTLNPYRFDRDKNHIVPEALKYICKFIEDNAGRLSPVVFDIEEYNRKKAKILHDINSDNHFDENSNPKFKNIINNQYLDSLLKETFKAAVRSRNRSKSPLRPITADLDDISSSESLSGSPRKRSHSNTPDQSRKKASSVRKSPLITKSDEIDPAIWVKFRKSVEVAVNQLTKEFKEYEKNPEKHPLYAEEWKKFWCRRFKEMKGDGKDPSKHDFRPEWIKFWTVRMKELHDIDIDKKKTEIRELLNLPDEEENDKPKFIPITSQNVIQISDSDSSEHESRHSSKSKKRVRTRDGSTKHSRSRSGSSDGSNYSSRRHRKRHYSHERGRRDRSRDSYRSRTDDYDFRHREYRKFMESSYDKITYDEWSMRYGYTARPHPSPPRHPNYTYEQAEDIDDGPVTFITVCRLLTALEDDLGEKLGNRITDLLAKALSLEKVKANSSDEVLLTTENCEFFEIIKERLKGRMIAKIVPSHKLPAVRKAIRNIATLIHTATELLEDQKEKTQPEVAPEPVKETSGAASDGGIDKAALAIEITKALIAQGKTDTTAQELEELIEVYVKMRQQSAGTATEAPKAEEEPVEIVKEKSPEKEKIIIPRERSVARKSESPVLAFQDGEKSPILAEPLNILEEDSKKKATEQDLNSLNDDDLKTLLQNFTDLSHDEQKYLITYLKEIEVKDPKRVERLKKYVKIDDSPKPSTSRNNYSPNKVQNSDSDDYELDFSSVNAQKDRKANRSNKNFLLSDTSSMVANLMGSLQNSVQESEMPAQSIPSLSSTSNNMNGSDNMYYQYEQQYDQMMQQINYGQTQPDYMNMYQQNNYGNPYYDMNGPPGTNPMNPINPMNPMNPQNMGGYGPY